MLECHIDSLTFEKGDGRTSLMLTSYLRDIANITFSNDSIGISFSYLDKGFKFFNAFCKIALLLSILQSN